MPLKLTMKTLSRLCFGEVIRKLYSGVIISIQNTQCWANIYPPFPPVILKPILSQYNSYEMFILKAIGHNNNLNCDNIAVLVK